MYHTMMHQENLSGEGNDYCFLLFLYGKMIALVTFFNRWYNKRNTRRNTMKIAHLGDLHIGRRFGEYDLIDDQRYILNEILKILETESIDVVMISGDVYDKVSPSAQAFSLWSKFLNKLNNLDLKILVTSGNHDSSDRLGIASEILSQQNIHIESEYKGEVRKIALKMSNFLPSF